jgi:hypothetical protein
VHGFGDFSLPAGSEKHPLKSNILRPVKKVPDARRAMAAERRRTLLVRWSESDKRNEADGLFSPV